MVLDCGSKVLGAERQPWSTGFGRLPFFFFNDTVTPEIYTLSLHDALPIYFLQEKLAITFGYGEPVFGVGNLFLQGNDRAIERDHFAVEVIPLRFQLVDFGVAFGDF